MVQGMEHTNYDKTKQSFILIPVMRMHKYLGVAFADSLQWTVYIGYVKL